MCPEFWVHIKGTRTGCKEKRTVPRDSPLSFRFFLLQRILRAKKRRARWAAAVKQLD
jgi:hypothetical protein